MYKVVIYLENICKPLVFTCTEEKDVLVKKIEEFLNSGKKLLFDNGDILICNDMNTIKNILITTDKKDA